MTAQNPPIFIQAGSHPAEDTRRFIDALVDGRKGIVGPTDFAVTENGTPNMSVNVAGGRAFISGTQATYHGMYFAENRGVTNLSVTAAHATLARKDLVVAKVEDASYSGGVSTWSLAVVAGTAAGSPTEPAVPNNALVLAMIDVPAADTAIQNAQITDRRTSTSGQGRASALGGVITCTSTTRPSHVEGRVIYETDTDKLKTSNGSAWADVGAAAGSFVRKTADESVQSSTTMQNDDHLVLAVASSTTYLMEARLACDGSNGTAGPNLAVTWTVPTGATMRWGTEDVTLGSVDRWAALFDDVMTFNHTSYIGTDVLVSLYGILIVSTTAGNLQLRWAQLDSNANATRLFTGSSLKLTPVT